MAQVPPDEYLPLDTISFTVKDAGDGIQWPGFQIVYSLFFIVFSVFYSITVYIDIL